MKGSVAIYLGRIVDKTNFRTFVYGPQDTKKLVESWDDFESHMATGLWFATTEDARVGKTMRPKRIKKRKEVTQELIEEDFIEDEEADKFDAIAEADEILDDDFLPNTERK